MMTAAPVMIAHGLDPNDRSLYPDESGFDDRLRDLAARILDEEAPDADQPFGRDWHRFSIFSTMQTYAAARDLTGTAADMAACEELGRVCGRLKAGRG